jgi:polysaccharide export outer membrane protein
MRAAGTVSLPAGGQVTAAGKTLAQLESELKRLYSSQITNTDVLLTLDSAVIEVYMSGAVRSPGKLVFDRPTTLLQAIMQAGGPSPFGNMRSVRVIRLGNGIQRMQLVDLRPTLAGEPTKPFYVKNGDIVQVPQSAF